MDQQGGGWRELLHLDGHRRFGGILRIGGRAHRQLFDRIERSGLVHHGADEPVVEVERTVERDEQPFDCLGVDALRVVFHEVFDRLGFGAMGLELHLPDILGGENQCIARHLGIGLGRCAQVAYRHVGDVDLHFGEFGLRGRSILLGRTAGRQGQKGRCREHSETETFHGWGGFKGDWLMGRRVGL